ncbi:RodZ domain-containing protein [Thioalkalivibrio sp. ALJ24]|uniref:RodZ domain-containing protein n=1 Tax=Thioalkalivibrio sp. ALJ24 TaxID=545276 RepID=UPI000367A4C0|nr:RodZ domain-containing protein [Thioalkalivibrio sp. ALJ24]
MADRGSREPDLGRVEDVDDTAAGRPPLSASGGPGHEEEPPVTSGLTIRDRPFSEEGPESPGDDDGEAQPGRGLRVAREAAGLELAELSRRTHLGRSLLADLEANRFDHITPAYVRGYLRSCARELGVDPDPWIRAYDRRAPAEPDPRPVATRRHRPRGRRRLWPWWLGALLIAGVLALAVALWTEELSMDALPFSVGENGELAGALEPEGEHEEPAATAPDEDPTVEAEAPTIGPPEPLAPPEEEEAAREDEDRSEDADVVDAEDPSAAEPGVAAAPAGLTHGMDEGVLPRPLAVTRDAPEAAADTEEAEIDDPAPAEGMARLELEISETSWVEIRDASDAVVLTGVLSADTREELELELPGRAVLGNAPGVELTLNGESVDFEEHVRGDRTARFDLDE